MLSLTKLVIAPSQASLGKIENGKSTKKEDKKY